MMRSLSLVFFAIGILGSYSFLNVHIFEISSKPEISTSYFSSTFEGTRVIATNFINDIYFSKAYLLNKRVLSKALQNLEVKQENESRIINFSEGDCKTILVALINAQVNKNKCNFHRILWNPIYMFFILG